MTIKIEDSRHPKPQFLTIEHSTFSDFVGGAVVRAAMSGDIIRTSYEYVNEVPVFTLQGLRKSNGHSWSIKWTRSYTLLED